MLKRMIMLSMVLFILLISVSSSEGLFPKMDEIFGTAMPSVGLSIGRTTDNKKETDEGSQESYTDFKNEDYIAFGQYLSGIGAIIDDYIVENSTVTVCILVRDSNMVFSYNWNDQTATVEYPLGTRVETEIEKVELGDSILPPIGGVMPSPEFAINRKPDSQETNDEGVIQYFNEFSDDNYLAFGTYLAGTGATLRKSNIDSGVLKATIALNGFSFDFVFDWNTRTAKVIYPKGTKPETSRWNVLLKTGFVLPDINGFGSELPRVSMALKREPSSAETLIDGSLQEIYYEFSDEDYDSFSNYLKERNCTVDSYYTTDENALVIQLNNGSRVFTFTYDGVRHIGTLLYPPATRVEEAWVPTPKPETTQASQETTKLKLFSESACWNIAYNYFMNLRWKDPESLKIYGHSASFKDDQYLFTIDYSAANGFGGTNRGYYWITVDATNGSIRLAFGND